MIQKTFIQTLIILMSASYCAHASDINITGVYDGIIASGNNFKAPGTTILKQHQNGKITGEYYFEGDLKTEQGTLNNCKLSNRILYCIWEDPYGEGDLIVKFSKKHSKFKGAWYDNQNYSKNRNGSKRNLWKGKKRQKIGNS